MGRAAASRHRAPSRAEYRIQDAIPVVVSRLGWSVDLSEVQAGFQPHALLGGAPPPQPGTLGMD